MNGNELLTLVVELLFALVFVRALVEYVRRRDPLSRDVALVFTPLALLFVLELVRRTVGAPPTVLTTVAALLVLAQPYLTLRLVAQIRAIPRSVLVGAFAVYLLTAVPLVVWPRPVPAVVTLSAVAVFVVAEAIAAVYLALEARRRIGSARARLATAAVATALFAIAVLAAGAAAASSGVAGVANLAARIVALLAALGYLIAFMPPAWLRRMWEASAAYQYTERLMQTPPTEEIGAIWQRFAGAAVEISGVDAAVVIVGEPDASARVVASSGLLAGEEGETCPREELERLLHRRDLPFERPLAEGGEIVSRLGEKAAAGCFTVVPLRPPRVTRPAALLLFAQHQTLFSEDDRALLAALGAQTVILTERRAILTEQQRLATELATTVEALRAASQAKSDFVASMSHELRTPLNAIIGFSELMLSEPRSGQEIVVPTEWVEHIHSSGNHLLALINDVLDLAKIEAGRLELHAEPFDVPSAVSESLAGLRPLAERKRLRLESAVEPVAVVADRGRFRQILYNLLSNAIKFTPEHGTVRVEARRSDGEVLVAVVDTGIGIAPEDQGHVFEEFRQVGDREQAQAGTGLGLALTRRLVEAHGGRIELESTVGVGSRFTVFLPHAQTPVAPVPEPAPAVLPDAVERRRAEVLLIEDDPSAVRLLRTYLEADGYDVRVATSGEAGLQDARARPPAAILLDILLPGMDGWEVLRRVKADDHLRDIPAIIVTVVDEREVGLALGAVDYFLKPVDRQALLDRLSRYTFTSKVKKSRVRVLIVDDDAATRETVGAALRQEGFEVVTAAGGREAVDLARADAIDLVLCDLVMPDLDGFGVVAALKSDEKTRDTPILILTGHELTPAEKAALNGNILGVVGKGEDGHVGLRRWLASVVPPVGAATAGEREAP